LTWLARVLDVPYPIMLVVKSRILDDTSENALPRT
jgi:hypothetical protein